MKTTYTKPPKLLSSEYASFREDVIRFLVTRISNRTKLLDPMAGTAPLIPFAELNGLEAHFYDLLPVHFVVNNAKKQKVYHSLLKRKKREKNFLQNKLTALLKPLEGKELNISEHWLDQDTANILKKAWERTENFSNCISILLKAGLVLSVRYFGSYTTTRNNTWIKKGGMAICESVDSVANLIAERIEAFYHQVYGSNISSDNTNISKTHLYNGDSSKVRLKKNKYTVVTSPAFANRYDYIQAYYPELLFLHYAISSPHPSDLKERIIATNQVKGYIVTDEKLSYIKGYSPSAFSFIENVKEKAPKSRKRNENNYYFRYFTRYYENLFKHYDKLCEILSNGSEFYVIVQNNIHRGEINEMDCFISEYLKNKGFNSKIIQHWARSHQGTRNISSEHPLVIKRQKESIIWGRKSYEG